MISASVKQKITWVGMRIARRISWTRIEVAAKRSPKDEYASP